MQTDALFAGRELPKLPTYCTQPRREELDVARLPSLPRMLVAASLPAAAAAAAASSADPSTELLTMMANSMPSPEDSACALYWVEKGNKPNVLLAMAIGLTDGSAERPCDRDDRLLADFTEEPYSKLSQNSPYNPRQSHLVAEIVAATILARSGVSANDQPGTFIHGVLLQSFE